MQNQKEQAKMAELDQENYARAARDILRHSIETAGSTEATTGEPGAQGFGGNSF
jgi:hypothetical protein